MPSTRLGRSVRVTLLGLTVNLVLAAAKLGAGLAGHSHALVADAVESLADVFSSLIVWRGVVVSAQPPDEDHPYGHGKAEPIAGAAVATMLVMAAIWISVQAVRGLMQPHEGPAAFTLAILAVVVCVKEGLYRYVIREASSTESSAIWSDAWHHRSDAITSIAAALGISVALVGGPAFTSADDIAALIAAVIVAWNGWRLLQPVTAELMDRSPDLRMPEEIRRIARLTPGVADVEKCLVRKMGYQYFVDMHVEVNPQMTVERGHQVAHEVKDRVRTQMPKVVDVLVHIEPETPGK